MNAADVGHRRRKPGWGPPARKGETLRVSILTGASTGPELDGELGAADAVSFRSPYQSDPALRKRINDGEANYNDMHLSHLSSQESVLITAHIC